MLVERIGNAIDLKGLVAGRQFVDDHAQGVQIATTIDLPGAHTLFGRHIGQRPHRRSGRRLNPTLHQTRQAKIVDFYRVFLPTGRGALHSAQQQISRLDVAMNHLHRVSCGQPFGNLATQVEHKRQWQ